MTVKVAQSERPLAGKVVVVTGASRRLGRCYAMALGKAGARVVALARTMGEDPESIGTLLELETTGRRCGYDITAMRCDLEDEDSVSKTIADIAEGFGTIDGIVNNAVLHSERRKCRGIPRSDWDQAFAVNVRAPYLLIDSAIPYLEQGDGGSVVNITSLSAGPTGKGGGAHKGLLLYGLTKAALNRMTTWYAAELEDRNIAVNAISPGDVSAYLRMANAIEGEVSNSEVVAGEQCDEAFWGDPVVWLLTARPDDMTGKIVHTYTFGDSWGAPPRDRSLLSPELLKILGHDNVAKRD